MAVLNAGFTFLERVTTTATNDVLVKHDSTGRDVKLAFELLNFRTNF